MSDDLVKRLREGATWDDDIAAADRIEELEAKLAKAVEALEYYAAPPPPPDVDDSLLARAALAELKGETDD